MKALHCVFVAALCVVGLFVATELRASAATLATFVVNSTGNQHDDAPGNGVCHTSAGTCTLRAAIEESNALAGADTIHFALLGGGIHVIKPHPALPKITDHVGIDGTTQTNSAAFPCIVLDGIHAGNATGLEVSAGGTLIRGLDIERFKGPGILLEGYGGNQIIGDFIGTDVSGTLARGNAVGVSIQDTDSNSVGGTTAPGRNVISGNSKDGVLISGTQALGNNIEGDYIGTDLTGTKNLGNGGSGVRLRNGARGNVIGYVTVTGGNKIAFNANVGVFVGTSNASSDTTRNNMVRENSIWSNGGLGIDLGGTGVTPNDKGDNDTGPNNFQNFPKVKSAVSATKTIKGSLNSTPNTGFTIEFFASPVCDTSGHGEGQNYLASDAVTTDGSGNVSFTINSPVAFPVGAHVTATATNADESTSEFGKCKTAI